MYDIASSKYKQLCEIRKIDNQNLEVKEEEQPMEWQPKGRRMMQLYLTDGVQDVTAIEYTSLKQITVWLFPLFQMNANFFLSFSYRDYQIKTLKMFLRRIYYFLAIK